MKRILPAALTLWAGFVFVVTMLPVIPLLWLTGRWPEPRRTDFLLRVVRVWIAVFFLLSGIRLTVRGREKFAARRNYVVVCNHNSMMDVPVTSPGIPGVNKTIAKVEMARIPLFGVIYRRGAILVDRRRDQSRRESYQRMREVLAAGMHMCIYPEGTRNKTGRPLKEFHDGAFRLAFDTGKPIMPAVIFGTARMLPADRSWTFRPGRIEMHFLDPIEAGEGDTADTLKERTFRAMWDHYENNRPKGL